MKVLLTGGGGLFGRALLRVAAQTKSAWRIDAPPRAALNLFDQSAVQAWFAARRYDLVIHAAAKVGGIRANIAEPASFIGENLLINAILIEEARKAEVPALLYLGSSCMYPRNRDILREADMLTGELEPTNEAYAVAKIAGGKMCEAISRQYGLAYKTIVPCNLYGPDDHFDLERGHLAAAALRKLHDAVQAHTPAVTIWGDGTARREFLYVDDLADFVLRFGGDLSRLPDMLNVGAGVDHEVNTYYQAAAEAVGFKGCFEHDLAAPVGMARKLMDVSKVTALGWQAATPLAEGMRKAYQGFLAQKAQA